MTTVIKTTSEEEQRKKDEAFCKMMGVDRLDVARRVRKKMKKSNVNCSYGLKVKITRF